LVRRASRHGKARAMSSHKPMSPEQIRRVLVFCGLAAAMSVAISAVLAITVLTTRGDVSQGATNATVAKKRADVAQDVATVAKDKATRLETKVVQTRVLVRQTRTVLKQKGILGKQGRTGAAGRNGNQGARGPGPTPQQIEAAVTNYCNTTACGKPPTVDQVLEGLRRCSDGGGCRGADGEDGKDAPPPSDMQILAGVAAYCAAHGACTGAQGMPGTDGSPGPEGPPGPAGPVIPCALQPPEYGYVCTPVVAP
jgi:hypothetical protein